MNTQTAYRSPAFFTCHHFAFLTRGTDDAVCSTGSVITLLQVQHLVSPVSKLKNKESCPWLASPCWLTNSFLVPTSLATVPSDIATPHFEPAKEKKSNKDDDMSTLFAGGEIVDFRYNVSILACCYAH